MDRRTLGHGRGKMRARALTLCLSLLVLACDDQSTTPTGPTAEFTITPPAGWTDVEFLVDASTSSDPYDDTSELMVRWDWDDDGVWDTQWTADKMATHRYATEGRPIVRLEVRDPSGQTDQTTRQAYVTHLTFEEILVEELERAYREQDLNSFAAILADDPGRNAEFRFILSYPTDLGETEWAYEEEVRIHQRMFHPEAPPPGDPEVNADLWLQTLTITLAQLEIFTERPDLYSVNGGLDGKLDPAVWRATDARYSTYVFFDLVGTDFKVEGEANFVVIEDRTKNIGDAGKFLIYIWEDMPGFLHQSGIAVEANSWSDVKGLYR
jgi:PKD repeat protein